MSDEPTSPTPADRAGRIATRTRNPKWKNPALRIDMDVCINCDTCLRHCPPHFGAIFNHGMDVVIISELCSGCGKCLPPVCPVDCIHSDDDHDMYFIDPEECIDCDACAGTGGLHFSR